VAIATPEFSIFYRYIYIFLLLIIVYICLTISLYHKSASGIVVKYRNNCVWNGLKDKLKSVAIRAAHMMNEWWAVNRR
jgi:hypothetical protein